MTDITDMVDEILQEQPQRLHGYIVGSCMYMQQSNNRRAWIEGKAVDLGDWQ